MRGLHTKFVLVLVLCLYVLQFASGSVLGVDLSAEFLKVAAVKSGNPFHIVVDEQAKRKIPVAVAFDDGERHFGNNAVGFAIRKPLDTFMWAHRLLGQTIDSERVTALQRIFPYDYVTLPNRGKSVGIKTKEGVIYSPEELVAMSLEHVRKIAKDDGNGVVKDVVLSVPSWFTQKEREAVIIAAELGGMSVMSLISDNAATAVTYGIDRTYHPNTTHTAMILDMGSAGFEVSIVEYSAAKSIGYGKNIRYGGQVHILASTFDDTLGGMAFDVAVRDLLIDRFIKQHGKKADGILSNARAMAKLLKQANTVKTILSANQNIPVRVDSVYNDLDLATAVTRDDFYEVAKPLFARITKPILDALAVSSLNNDAVEAVVIVGGSTRIPGVQATIKEVLKRDTLHQNVNSDEAMVMGAVFKAANISTTFQVRNFGLNEVSSYGVSLNIEGVNSDLQKTIDVFPKGSALGKKKVLSIAHSNDLTLTLSHKSEELLSQTVDPFLRKYTVSGVTDVIADSKNAEYIGDDKTVKIALTIGLSDAGIVTVSAAEVVFEIEEPVVLANGTVTEEKRTRKIRTPLGITIAQDGNPTGFIGVLGDVRTTYVENLAALTVKDQERRALAAARNSLESKIYQVRNELNDEIFETVTNDAEREALSAKSNVAEEWMYETDNNTSMEDYVSKLEELDSIFRSSAYKKNQIAARKSAQQTVTSATDAARKQVSNWSVSKPWVKDEAKKVYELAQVIAEEVEDMILKQKGIPLTSEPLFDAKDILSKLKPLAVMITRVEKIKKPLPPKKNVTKKNETTTEKTTTEDATTPTEDSTTEKTSETPKSEDKASKDEL